MQAKHFEDWLQVRSAHILTDPLKNEPSWVQHQCKIHQIVYKISARHPLGGVWGPSWPKSQHKPENVDFRVSS